MQGAFLAIKDGELKGYTLTLDRDGYQVQQKELRVSRRTDPTTDRTG
jgi:hypothetical protein